jgi:hypothetical protein
MLLSPSILEGLSGRGVLWSSVAVAEFRLESIRSGFIGSFSASLLSVVFFA